MGKQESIDTRKVALLSAQDGAINDFGGGCFDDGRAEGVASVPPADADEQAKIDAAVAAKVAELQPVIDALQAKDDADVAALSSAQSAMADLQKRFDDLSTKEGVEASVISGLQGAMSQLQSAVALLSGLPLPAVPAQ